MTRSFSLRHSDGAGALKINSRSAAIFLLVVALTSFTFVPKKKVLFFGDSITAAGVKPGGYVARMDGLAAAEKLTDKFEFSGSGIGGNKVYDLYLRIDDDVLSKSPDIVVIYIGVNDVWHKRSLGTGTDADKFENFYLAILKKLKERNIKVALCTPAAIGEKIGAENELDGDLNKYAAIIRSIAAKNDLPLIDLRKATVDYDSKNNKDNKPFGILTSDGVHLNDAGNQFVAEEMWKVIKGMD